MGRSGLAQNRDGAGAEKIWQLPHKMRSPKEFNPKLSWVGMSTVPDLATERQVTTPALTPTPFRLQGDKEK